MDIYGDYEIDVLFAASGGNTDLVAIECVVTSEPPRAHSCHQSLQAPIGRIQRFVPIDIHRHLPEQAAGGGIAKYQSGVSPVLGTACSCSKRLQLFE